ncbi:MarR family transcriptional regulator [Microbispora sp. NEAU-D428]|uniref:MarR family winged helix-turn-helix transcriptional regulator n=1 Tax=Microbispora sitophila TaxID=2771537 RepID=UPI00186753AB|nr:MarR family transcriptional regulator [Microbispora sitophila]MBE3015196.1 MarR family transcriptional regulator [Microbispora sitophila]
MNDQVLALAQAIKAAQREIERRSSEALRHLGVTPAQAEAILIIGANEPLALREPGTRIIAESGHPSRLVDRLVDAGLVQRRIPPDDRRRVELTLAPRGRALAPEIVQAQQSMLAWGAQALTGHDVPGVLAALHAILRDSLLADVLGVAR